MLISHHDITQIHLDAYNIEALIINRWEVTSSILSRGDRITIYYSDIKDSKELKVTTNHIKCFHTQNATGNVLDVRIKIFICPLQNST